MKLIWDMNGSIRIIGRTSGWSSLNFEEIKMDVGYRIDLLIEKKVIIEIKSVENLAEVHHKQIITYLRLSGKKAGILVNFNTSEISKEIHRKVNNFKN